MNPSISVIMPVFNAEKSIAKAIDSIVHQTYTNWELLICDDASTDSSFKIALAHAEIDARIKVSKNEKNMGSLMTRNKMFKETLGEFIALQDADDTSSSERFEKQMDQFVRNSDLALCGTWARYYLNEKLLFEKKTAIDAEDIFIKILNQNQFCSASILFKKLVLNDVDGYREYFKDKGNYDYDFTSRVVDKFKTHNIDEFLYHVNINNESNSKVIDNEWPIKLESDKIVQYLILQRRQNLKDAIEENDIEALDELESRLLNDYKKNPFLVHDKRINYLLNTEQSWLAVKYAFNITLSSSLNPRALQLLFYSLKKTLKSWT